GDQRPERLHVSRVERGPKPCREHLHRFRNRQVKATALVGAARDHADATLHKAPAVDAINLHRVLSALPETPRASPCPLRLAGDAGVSASPIGTAGGPDAYTSSRVRIRTAYRSLRSPSESSRPRRASKDRSHR